VERAAQAASGMGSYHSGTNPDGTPRELHRPGGGVGLNGRGLHSSTFRLNVSIFCGIRWVHDFPSVYSPGLLDRGTPGGVTKTAQVELKSGRV